MRKQKNSSGTFDALVLPGGPNPTPRFYHEDPIWSIGPTYEKRDKFEIDLIQACIKAGKPILGICRGLQILNVALGGTLWQDMQSQNSGAFIQHMQRAPGNIATHYIEVEKDTRLMDILGEGLYVNSRHREGIKKLAQGLRRPQGQETASSKPSKAKKATSLPPSSGIRKTWTRKPWTPSSALSWTES